VHGCGTRTQEITVSYLQAIVIALVQGVTELFPVSSLGHSVLVPAWIGGSWHTLVNQPSRSNSGSSGSRPTSRCVSWCAETGKSADVFVR
jgi:hypothetical protein